MWPIGKTRGGVDGNSLFYSKIKEFILKMEKCEINYKKDKMTHSIG